jgi:hypothetical protein
MQMRAFTALEHRCRARTPPAAPLTWVCRRREPVSPDSPTYNQVSVRTNFVARKYAFVNSGWLAVAIQYWGGAQAQTPPGKLDIVAPFGADGGKGSFYSSTQLFGSSLIKKASEARVKDLLRFFNFLAAPFGSEEYLLINYGVPGKDFNFDDQGNPVLTSSGKASVNSLWTYILQPPQVYYNATKPKDFRDTDAERCTRDDRRGSRRSSGRVLFRDERRQRLDRQPGLPRGSGRHHRRPAPAQRL